MTDKNKLTDQLNIAKSELKSWQEYDYRREDGSQRQDQMHEKRGRELQQKVHNLEQEVNRLIGNQA